MKGKVPDVREAQFHDETRRLLDEYVLSLRARGLPGQPILESCQIGVKSTLVALWGYSPYVDRPGGVHFSEEGFRPYWEHLVEYQHCYEMLCLVGEERKERILFIPKMSVDKKLLAMCRMYGTSKPVNQKFIH